MRCATERAMIGQIPCTVRQMPQRSDMLLVLHCKCCYDRTYYLRWAADAAMIRHITCAGRYSFFCPHHFSRTWRPRAPIRPGLLTLHLLFNKIKLKSLMPEENFVKKLNKYVAPGILANCKCLILIFFIVILYC